VTSDLPGSTAGVDKKPPPKVGWTPAAELDERTWAATGRRMSLVDRASQWWIGDWLRYGSARWGDRYAQAARITGYDVPSLRNMAWLAAEFDLSRRRDDLTWSHHAAVAGLPLDEREPWLDRAAQHRLSVAELRREIRAVNRRRAVSSSTPSPHEGTRRRTCPTCGQPLADNGQQ
jgi:hypothetical protein